MVSTLRKLVTALTGSGEARSIQRRLHRHPPSIEQGLAQLAAREAGGSAPDTSDVSPIFVLSAGWRSGSTLLQRLVLSDRSVLVWGEPYDRCSLVPRLAASVAAFTPGWPNAGSLLERRRDGLAMTWIANLYPSLADLKAAHRAMLDRLFGTPAYEMGYRRWGVKEVRLGAEHAFYLRWLYPQARFLFLYRDPFAAWASYRAKGGKWHAHWPDRPVFTPTGFGRLWGRLVRGFLDHHETLGARLVSYEALSTGQTDLGKLGEYLGTTVDSRVLSHRVGASRSPAGDPIPIPRMERWLLSRAVAPTARELGYLR